MGIPIDTFALKGRAQPSLRLESISLPTIAFTGEQFPIDVVVSTPKAGPAEVELTAEGRTLGKTEVALAAGENPIRLHASLNTPGALDLSVAIRGDKSQGAGEVRFDQAVMLRRPKVLYVTADSAAVNAHLSATLASAQFDLQRVSEFTATNLAEYQLVIFDNWDLEAIPTPRKDELERYVKQGGGLLVIGGERNVYQEGKKTEDALDRTLPAKLAPPRSPEGTAVVLIIDKSSSMEGRKMELARLAAIGVVDNLRPIDMVGVLIFDNSFQWAVPMRRAEDRTLIKRLISGITPDGGTQIAPALNEAFRRILPTQATYKHIVLLTDGISEEGDSLDLSREAVLRRVTISTVGLGQDVNRAYLEKVAQFAGGKSYFLNEPAGLEQILLRDVMEHTGTTAVEKPLPPKVLKQTEILDGVAMETAPALKGYVKFIAKPTAETILEIDRDPLLTRWQYGLGRSAVFASDAKARWAADWMTWKGYDKFWTNLTRDLLPHAQAGEASVEFDSANGDLVVDYRLGRDVEEPASPPQIFVFGPDGFQKPIVVKKIAAGTFRGRLQIGARDGLFRVRPLVDSRAFPEAGLVSSGSGAGGLRIERSAAETGRRVHRRPVPAESERRVRGRSSASIASTIQLWPGLLALADSAEFDRAGDAQVEGCDGEVGVGRGRHLWRRAVFKPPVSNFCFLHRYFFNLVQRFHSRRFPHRDCSWSVAYLQSRFASPAFGPDSRFFPGGETKGGEAFVAMDLILDERSAGSAIFRFSAEVADVVVAAIKRGDEAKRHYELHATSLMSNHVHMLARRRK